MGLARGILILGLQIIFVLSSSVGWSESFKEIYFRKKVISSLNEEIHFPNNKSLSGKIQQTWVLQFAEPVTEQLKTNLKSHQIQALRYIPEDALLVRATGDGLQDFNLSLSKSQGSFRVFSYDALLKLSPSLGSFSVFNAEIKISVLVHVFNSKDAETFQKELQNKKYDNYQKQKNDFKLTASRKDILELAQNSAVEFIQEVPSYEVMYFNPFGSDQTLTELAAGDYSDLTGMESGTQIMNLQSAWEQGFVGAGELVAMADTGLDSGDAATIHPDFSAAVFKGQAVGLFSKSWADPMGHGTHVSGSILGRGTASQGILKGGAYGAQMIVQGMWSPMLDNLSVPSKMGDLFKKAYDEGARVHSNSWGSPKSLGEYDNFASQTDEFIYQHPDMLVLFAAGNSGVDADRDGRIDSGSISSPGTAKNVLTVGASENEVLNGGIQVPAGQLRQGSEHWGVEPIASDRISNNRNGLAMFSSRGPTQDGRIKPEIVAPGTNILSVRSQEKGASVLWGAYNNDYAWAGGTSMATPLTAGAATLAREYLKKSLNFKNPSGALLKAFLLHKSVDMYPGQFGEVGQSHGQEILTHRPNSDEGYGRVDLVKLTENSGSHFYDEAQGVAQGEDKIYSFEVIGPQGSLLANLVWSDAPASPAAGKSLVNDLDLILLNSQNQVVVDSKDHTNNHEMIELKNLAPGNYKLIVRGYKIPDGKSGRQAFSLIFTI